MEGIVNETIYFIFAGLLKDKSQHLLKNSGGFSEQGH
jgi:hypothetical protein